MGLLSRLTKRVLGITPLYETHSLPAAGPLLRCHDDDLEAATLLRFLMCVATALLLRVCFALVVSSRSVSHAGLMRRFDADPIHGSLIDFKNLRSEGQKCGHGLIFRLLRLGVVDSLRGCAAAAPSFRSEPS